MYLSGTCLLYTSLEKYGEGGSYKKKFGVSTQHYSFAVKAFVDMAKEFDMSKYEFAIRETRTAEDVYKRQAVRDATLT